MNSNLHVNILYCITHMTQNSNPKHTLYVIIEKPINVRRKNIKSFPTATDPPK